MFVYVNMAATVDGKITSSAREHPDFASRADRRRMDRLRATADALMVGAGSVRADDPTWHVRDEALRAGASGPHRVLVSASARVPTGSRFFDGRYGGESIVLTTDRAERAALEAIAGRARVWRLGADRVDLRAAIGELEAFGVRRLLVEGGAELNWAMFDLDLVDELHLTLAPALLGGREAPTLLGGAGWTMGTQRRLRLVELEREGDELFLRYAVARGPRDG